MIKKLNINSLYSCAGQGFYSLTQWVLLIVIARLSGATQLGLFSLGLAISAPVVMFFSFRLRLILVSDTQAQHEISDYLFIRLFMMACALLLILVITACFIYNLHSYLIIAFIGLAKCCEGVSEIGLVLAQREQKSIYTALSMNLRGILTTVAVAILLITTQNLLYASIGMAVTWLLVLLFIDLRIPHWLNVQKLSLKRTYNEFKNIRADKNFQTKMLKLLKMGGPLALVAVFNSLDTNTPKYFISHFMGHAGLGYYAPLSFIMTGSIVLVGMAILPYVPKLTHAYNAGDTENFHKNLKILVLFTALIGVSAMLFSSIAGGWLLNLMFGAQFAKYHIILTLLMLGATLNYLALIHTYLLTGMRKLYSQIIMFFVSFCISIVCSALLIPHLGLYGAALSVIISATWLLGSFMVILKKATRTKEMLAGHINKDSHDHEHN